MTAYVTADINMESISEAETLDVCAYEVLLRSTTQEWILEAAGMRCDRINNTFHADAIVQSDMFTPIKGDFLLTFKTREMVPEFPSFLVPSLFTIALFAIASTEESIPFLSGRERDRIGR